MLSSFSVTITFVGLAAGLGHPWYSARPNTSGHLSK